MSSRTMSALLKQSPFLRKYRRARQGPTDPVAEARQYNGRVKAAGNVDEKSAWIEQYGKLHPGTEWF